MTPAMAQDVSEADRDVARGLMLRVGKYAKPIRPRCEAPKGDDIVVCARDNEQFRAQSSSAEDPTGKAGTNDGRLTPPDVAGNGIFKGKPTIGGMCLIPPCAGPKAYMIDLASIPEAPAGSDADRIAKGEIKAP
ncbi:conserved hypothetical protein [Novosphingobium sp. 9U]|nr:conserved hypothetical protein [Novosphingobium sp. 9U]